MIPQIMLEGLAWMVAALLGTAWIVIVCGIASYVIAYNKAKGELQAVFDFECGRALNRPQQVGQ